MPIEIRMPELSASMTEADVIAWLVTPGEHVEAGDVIAEIETDKSTVELEAPASGALLEIVVPEGTTGVKVGEVLALMDADPATEAPSPQVAESPPAPAGSELSAAPAESPVAATALARRVAEQAGLDLGSVRGSGSSGRIVKADVEAALHREPIAAPGPAVSVSHAPSHAELSSETPYVELPHTRMRRTIATRLSQAKQTVPHFYLRIECEVDRLLATRHELNAGGEGRRISLNDFVVLAAALALREVPMANVAWSESGLRRFERVDMAVAVATDKGLITPIVRAADRKGLIEISQELRELAERARAGTLQPNEYRGGTFCVSNLGMYEIEEFSAVITPSEGCALAVGAIIPQPMVREGEITVAHRMKVTLSCDHRIIDGAGGAKFLQELKRILENPILLAG